MRLSDEAREGWFPDHLAEGVAGEAFEVLLESYVQRGDVEGFALAAAEGLAQSPQPGGESHCRSVVARAAAQLGEFPVVCQMLYDMPSRGPTENRLLLEAYLRLGQRERARELQALDDEFRDVMDQNQGVEGEP